MSKSTISTFQYNSLTFEGTAMSRFKSSVQPLCRMCGRPIRKRTESLYFGRNPELDPLPGYSSARPTSWEEAQKHSNLQVISVKWHSDRSYIWGVGLWDGKSWDDEFFCTARCAVQMGYSAAAEPHRLVTEAYRKARAARGQG